MRLRLASFALISVAAMSGCDDAPKVKGEKLPDFPPAAAPGAAAPGSPAAPIATGSPAQPPLPGQASSGDAIKDALLAEVRKRKFKNEDFVESDTNRDPFRSFLSDFSGGPTIATPQYEILMPKYSLDEVKLAMIVGPPTETLHNKIVPARGVDGRHVEPRAMFIDPNGQGVTVIRGRHLSKSDAKVIRIEPDKGKVFVEIKEDLGNGKFRMVERVLELHQGEPATEGNP